MFKTIKHISDIQPAVADKKEIRFLAQPYGITLGCYLFMDSKTFDSPEAIECRGIAFDETGAIVSRPLHKFFNVGEKEWLFPDKLLLRSDIVAIFDKIDGSMIATAWIDGELRLRSKKAFNSKVVKLAYGYLDHAENANIGKFMHDVARDGMTAIFELTHPDARIVVSQNEPALKLLHVRDNVTGAYVMLDPGHRIHDLIATYNVPTVKRFEGMSLANAMETLTDMRDSEGYVIQFANGDMAKIKCPWYARLHRTIALLRERDIAVLALNEELDDVKGGLREIGIDLTVVEEVETRLKGILSEIFEEIERVYESGKDLDRKDFALRNNSHPLFGLIMKRYSGQEPNLRLWYTHNRLKEDFSLRMLADDARADAITG